MAFSLHAASPPALHIPFPLPFEIPPAPSSCPLARLPSLIPFDSLSREARALVTTTHLRGRGLPPAGKSRTRQGSPNRRQRPPASPKTLHRTLTTSLATTRRARRALSSSRGCTTLSRPARLNRAAASHCRRASKTWRSRSRNQWKRLLTTTVRVLVVSSRSFPAPSMLPRPLPSPPSAHRLRNGDTVGCPCASSLSGQHLC